MQTVFLRPVKLTMQKHTVAYYEPPFMWRQKYRTNNCLMMHFKKLRLVHYECILFVQCFHNLLLNMDWLQQQFHLPIVLCCCGTLNSMHSLTRGVHWGQEDNECWENSAPAILISFLVDLHNSCTR